MQTLAYCAASFTQSVHQASGVKPLVSPPMVAEDFNPLWLTGHKFLYFKLHGLQDQPFWYGDNYLTALTATQIKSVNLAGTTVFVANCYLVGKQGQSPMLDALLSAGAQAVLGGPGLNYSRSQSVDGADLLGQAFRIALSINFSPATAFKIAKFRLQATMRHDSTIQDTLQFRLFQRQPYLEPETSNFEPEEESPNANR